VAKEPGRARLRIIEGATRLLQESGYDGFSLRKLGLMLGLTAQAVYIHFKDKDDLLRAVLDREFAAAAPLWFAANPLSADADAYARLVRLVRFYLTMGLQNPVSYRIRFFHDRGVDEQIREWAAGNFAPEDNARHLRDALAAWAAGPTGKENSPRETNGLFLETWAFMHGLILAYAPLQVPLTQKIDTAQAAVELHLGGWYAKFRL
jgi:AcrR family transcriptional regulator